MATWRELIGKALRDGDVLISNTLSEEEMDREFDDDLGIEEGLQFTAWSKDWVYFPVCYDGSEWVGSVPRNPNGEATSHQGC